MTPSVLERYQQKLRDIRGDLVAEFQSDAEAIAEDVQPQGAASSLPTHPADQDSEGVAERVELGEMEKSMVEQVDAALRRIEEGTFGVCESCGAEIPKARLDAIPYATYCVECARQHEQDFPPVPAIDERY